MHRIYQPEFDPAPGTLVRVDADEAHHALRVKRLRIGQSVHLFDGSGTTALATVHSLSPDRRQPALLLRITHAQKHPPLVPQVHVLAPAPKGSALEHMLDQLSQIGAASWQHLQTERTERQPRNLDRLTRTTIESAKQCGRAYLLQIRPPITLHDALALPHAIVADADAAPPSPAPAHPIHLILGPEGGWSDHERQLFTTSGVPITRFGPHIMRIETAAAVAAAAMLIQAAQEPAARPHAIT